MRRRIVRGLGQGARRQLSVSERFLRRPSPACRVRRTSPRSTSAPVMAETFAGFMTSRKLSSAVDGEPKFDRIASGWRRHGEWVQPVVMIALVRSSH